MLIVCYFCVENSLDDLSFLMFVGRLVGVFEGYWYVEGKKVQKRITSQWMNARLHEQVGQSCCMKKFHNC